MESDKIIISKVDESHIKIICDDAIKEELSQYMTFDVKGASYTPAFRARRWDGKKRLFNKHTKKMLSGLLPRLLVFAEDRKYTIEYEESAKTLEYEDEYSVYHAQKFIDSLDIHSGGISVKPRDNQFNAFRHIMQVRRALIKSPTASGKSLIAYLLFRQLLTYKNLRGLLVVPTTSLVEQMYTDFQDYSSHNGFSVDDNVHRIYEGHEKESDKSLFISTWQSLYTQPAEYFYQFDYIIGDEAHLCAAGSLEFVLSSCKNSIYRLGITGTLDDSKVHQLVIEGLFGSLRTVATTKEMMDKGELSQLAINCLVLKHSDSNCEALYQSSYEEEIKYLIGSEQRNKFIKNLAISMKNNTMVLYTRVETHGQILYDMIRNSENIKNRKVYFIHGGVDTEDREMIRKIVETEKNAIIVASFGTFSTGINIKNLHNIIFASPYKSIIKVLQSIGRSLRLFLGKDVSTLYDIADDLRYKDHPNHTLRHFSRRLNIYSMEKFTFKTYNIKIKE